MDTGLTLLKLFDVVYLAALGIWAGSWLFCYFEAARVGGGVRRDSDFASLRARALLWGAVCGAIALPALVCGAMGVPELRGLGIGVKAAVLLAALLLTLYRAARLSRRPHAKESTKPQALWSFVVEGLILCGVLGLIAAHAFREPPRTRGIEQLDPVARHEAYQAATRGKPEPVAAADSPANSPTDEGAAEPR